MNCSNWCKSVSTSLIKIGRTVRFSAHFVEMSSKKLKYSNNCNRESGVHFDPPYTTWVITALKIIFRWPPMETAVLRPQKRAHPGVWEKRHTKHPEKRLWLIDVLPMRPQRTDFSLWLRRVQPIREWQNVCIHNGSRWGHLTLRSSLYRFCRCLLYILIPVQSRINQGAQKKNKNVRAKTWRSG